MGRRQKRVEDDNDDDEEEEDEDDAEMFQLMQLFVGRRHFTYPFDWKAQNEEKKGREKARN